jgi:hypothetical protein
MNCRQPFLYELYPELMGGVKNQPQSNLYKCSSMGHINKPQIAQCLQCGLEQIPLSKQPKDLNLLYSEVVDSDYLENFKIKQKTFQNTFKKIKPFLPESPGVLLEIGSYCGLFLQEASKAGWQCWGIEPSKWAADYSRSANPNAKILNVNFEDDVSYKVLKEIMTSKYFVRSCMCRNYGKSDTEIIKMQYEMFKYCINAGAKMDKYMWLTSTGTLFQYINNYEIFVKGMKEMDWEIDYLEGLDWELLAYLLYKIDEGDLKMGEDVEIDLTMFNDLTESLDLVKSGWIRKYLLKRDISGYSNLKRKVEENMKYLCEVEKRIDELELGLVRDVIRYCVVKYL